MGIRMPSLSDLDTTKLIKSEDDLKEIPIIAVTALTMKDDERNTTPNICTLIALHTIVKIKGKNAPNSADTCFGN